MCCGKDEIVSPVIENGNLILLTGPRVDADVDTKLVHRPLRRQPTHSVKFPGPVAERGTCRQPTPQAGTSLAEPCKSGFVDPPA